MPNPHFKIAASQIRQGIAAKQDEINGLRRQIDEKDKQAQQTVEKLKAQIRLVEVDMAQPPEKQQDPSTDRARKSQLLLYKQKEIAVQQKDVMMERDRLTREIKDQERELMDLEQKARELEATQ